MFIGAHTKKTEKKQFGWPKAGGAQKNRSIKLSLRKQLASLRLRGDERSDERIDERITQLRKYLQKSDFIRSDKEEAVMRAELKDLEQLELKYDGSTRALQKQRSAHARKLQEKFSSSLAIEHAELEELKKRRIAMKKEEGVILSRRRAINNAWGRERAALWADYSVLEEELSQEKAAARLALQKMHVTIAWRVSEDIKMFEEKYSLFFKEHIKHDGSAKDNRWLYNEGQRAYDDFLAQEEAAPPVLRKRLLGPDDKTLFKPGGDVYEESLDNCMRGRLSSSSSLFRERR